MKYHIIDTFTTSASSPFSGNPAGVFVMNEWLSDELMQKIAAQNNLSETAFAVKESGGEYDLRWFTPKNEVDLCGHATLATAFAVMNFYEPGLSSVKFATQSGILTVGKNEDLYTLDFPVRMPDPVPVTPDMEKAIVADVLEAHGSRDLVLVLKDEAAVRTLAPDMALIEALPEYLGVCVTAESSRPDIDFVSRFFAPKEGIPEDPVTGSAHCNLVPLWADKLGKTNMTALQLSERCGRLGVRLDGDRVFISGSARLYLEGEIFV